MKNMISRHEPIVWNNVYDDCQVVACVENNQDTTKIPSCLLSQRWIFPSISKKVNFISKKKKV